MKIPDPIPADGVSIPLKVAFAGFKNVPLISFAHNSLAPRLLLFEDATQTRVIFSRRRLIAEIESIDVSKIRSNYHLKITWANRWSDFTAVVIGTENLLAAIEFFRRKGVALGDGAQRLIAESNVK